MSQTLRIAGICFGVFLIISALLDIAGLIPYSYEMPPIERRVLPNSVLMLGGLVLVIPFRILRARVVRFMAIVVLLGFCVLQSVNWLSGLVGFIRGEKDPMIVPVALIILLVLWGNLFLLWRGSDGQRLPQDMNAATEKDRQHQ